MKATHALLAFNRGLVSRLALARVDLKRMALSAAVQRNWIPRVLGSMMLRPGLGFLSATRSNAKPKHLPFVFGASDTALVELTNGFMRVRIADTIVRRPAVTSTLNRYTGAAFIASVDTASTFVDATDVSYWKDNDESGATSAFATGGYLSLLGNGSASAIRDRSVAVVEQNVEHSLTIVITVGRVMLRVGSTEGEDDLLTDRTLRAGTHSISVTPTGSTFFIRLSNHTLSAAMVDSVTMGQAAADLEIATPWLEADLKYVRSVQSADVIFLACKGYAPKRIERQGATSPRSWSLVEYAPDDGPFRDLNAGPVRMKVSALNGDVTLTAERAYFKATNVGSLFSLDSAGQTVSTTLTGADQYTNPIRVVGVGITRAFMVHLNGLGTWTHGSVVTLQQSVGDVGNWTDAASYTVGVSTPGNDSLDNQIIYYRLGIKAGAYGVGDTIIATLVYSAGSISGIGRVTAYTSPTVASFRVLTDFGAADEYTVNWREGDWSERRGYPSAVEIDDGRMWWAGKGFEWGSVSDAYDSFDDSITDESGPVRRTIGKGPIDNVNWLAAGSNLMLGTEGGVQVARSTSINEPLTQANFNLKPVSNRGTAAIQAVLLDTSLAYVGNDDQRLFELSYDGTTVNQPVDMTALVPEIGAPGFVGVAVQSSPDRRLHCWRSDGTVAILVFDKVEEVTCWVEVETDGEVEDVVVLPRDPSGGPEDRVYYAVKRTVNGSTVRYLERWAEETKAMGAADTRLADSFVTTTTAGLAIAGLSHLEGRAVVVWQDGVCPFDGGSPKLYTVTGGSITLDTAVVSFACAGLPYEALYQSAKGAVRDAQQVLLNQRQKVDQLGVVLADTHPLGLKYGTDFDNMDDMPLIDDEGAEVDPDVVREAYDHDAFTVNGTWSTDARICLKAVSPLPCTVMGISIGEQGHGR